MNTSPACRPTNPPSRRGPRARPWRRRPKGIAAVEFALLLPTLFLIFTAVFVFADAYFVRQRLQAAADLSARACVVENNKQACVNAAVAQAMGPFLIRCANLLPQVAEVRPGGGPINFLNVTLTCNYTGDARTAIGFLDRMGVNARRQMRVTAVMPTTL